MKKKAPNPLSNQLRIIGGKWRGRKLQFPDLEGLRPTGDRVRETLFNWLAPHIEDARCLDLFTGSGALALESLSRGAKHVVAIDNSPQVIQQLSAHKEKLDATGLLLRQSDAKLWLDKASQVQGEGTSPFDIVFLDPPFRANLLTDIVALIQQGPLLHSGTLVYMEADKNQLLPTPGQWHNLKLKTTGQIQYALFEVL